MKVVTPGVKKIWSTTVTCTGKGNTNEGCNAVLEVCYDDLFKTFHHCYDGSTDIYVTYCCPECKSLTDLPKSKYPKDWSLLLDQKNHSSTMVKKATLLECCQELTDALMEYQRYNNIGNDLKSDLFKKARLAIEKFENFKTDSTI